MKNKRTFHREDAQSSSGTLVLGESHIPVLFENISLTGARVRAVGSVLPKISTAATLYYDDAEGRLNISCKVLGMENEDSYRLKFDQIGEESLGNLLNFLRRLGGGHYSPDNELSKLVLRI